MMYMYLKNFKKKKYRFVHVTFMYYMYTHVYIPACELSLYQKVQRSLYYITYSYNEYSSILGVVYI